MTTRKFYTLFASLCLCFLSVNANAQDEPMSSSYTYTPQDMWELGIGAGTVFNTGDISIKPGFGAEIHLRRALDYVFSLRGEVSYFSFQGERENLITSATNVNSYKGNTINGSVSAVVSLSNLRWDKSTAERKVNLYAYAGVGAGSLGGEATRGDSRVVSLLNGGTEVSERAIVGYALGGAGLSFKVSPKMNISIEHQVPIAIGKQSDYLDGYANIEGTQTSFRDVLQFSTIRINFNLGDATKKSEPLYWINPMEGIAKNLNDLNERPVFDLTDTDGDGVIDMVDQEKDTPADAAVDTRGIALDSDGDGIKDYEDQEPYSQPGFSVDGKGVAQVPVYTTKDAVDASIEEALRNYQPIGNNNNSIADWFLPMIHFNNDSYSIRYSDYDNLASVATVMKNNPSIRILVRGFTDKVASDSYNTTLSYNRAKSAIEHLVSTYGISRDRLVLNYGGEENNLVPQSGSSLMNRRVEFSVAAGETNMPQPAGRAGKGTFGGSKSAGY